ncbi:MAG: DUF4230 domain-containing protein [Bacteroidales bacterium]
MRNLGLVILLILILASCRENRRAMVVSKIRQASLLATTEFTIDKTVFATREKKLLGLIKINQADFLAYTTAIVKTGIDLDKLQADDIVIEGKRISLKLPHVEVINFSYPVEKYRIDKEVTNQAFLNKFSIEDYDRFFQQAEIDIRNNLKYLGIIKTTEEKTRAMLEILLRNLDYKEIYITFDEGPLIREINTEPENQEAS